MRAAGGIFWEMAKKYEMSAAQLLLRSGESVSAASFGVGYESPTHFSRDFQRKFGVPPSKATLPLAENA